MIRQFTDQAGNGWTVELISHGNTSAYLNPRVHRAILQFTSIGRRTPVRYLGLPGDRQSLDELDDAELQNLLQQAAAH